MGFGGDTWGRRLFVRPRHRWDDDICNEYKFGFKIEAFSTLITKDLLKSLAGQQAQHSTRCIQFVLLH